MKTTKIYFRKKAILPLLATVAIIGSILISSCTSASAKVNLIDESSLVAIDHDLAEKGRFLFEENNCSSCHKFDVRTVGPPLKGVTQRRSSKWIMKMIMIPDEMIKNDDEAKKMLAEYKVMMPVQNINKEDARSILEYLRKMDSLNEI